MDFASHAHRKYRAAAPSFLRPPLLLLLLLFCGAPVARGQASWTDFGHNPPLKLAVSGHAKSHKAAMGTYDLDRATQSHGSVRYVQQMTKDDGHGHAQLATHGHKEPYYLYRSGKPRGRWIIVLGEKPIAEKQGVLITKDDTNDSPLGSNLHWLSAESESCWFSHRAARHNNRTFF